VTDSIATERVGRYQLLDPIGVGPSGAVSRAKVFGVAGFERQFAVKRFHAELTSATAMAQSLSAAARAYGSLEHPRIARMSEFGVAQGQTFTAVEYVAGLDALRLINEAKLAGLTLAAGGALALVSQAARAIGYAHGRGLTHLGLSPTNVIITVDGDVKITDFGILAATLPAQPIAMPRLAQRIPYLTPEQLANEATSAATDVFALGVIAYELVTGQRTFRGDTAAQIAQSIMSGPPAEPPLPRPIVRVLQRCLARSPFERFPDARALADALDAALRVAPVPGTRKDIGAQVKDTLDRLSALNEGALSGVVALNVGTGPVRAVARAADAPTRDSTPDMSTNEFVRPDTPVAGPSPLVGMKPGDTPAATLQDLPKPPMTTMTGLPPPPIPVPQGVAGPPSTPSPPGQPNTLLGMGGRPPPIPNLRGKDVGPNAAPVPSIPRPQTKPNGGEPTPSPRAATPPPIPPPRAQTARPDEGDTRVKTGPVPRAETGPTPRAETGPTPRLPSEAGTAPVPREDPPLRPSELATGPVPRIEPSLNTPPPVDTPPPQRPFIHEVKPSTVDVSALRGLNLDLENEQYPRPGEDTPKPSTMDVSALRALPIDLLDEEPPPPPPPPPRPVAPPPSAPLDPVAQLFDPILRTQSPAQGVPVSEPLTPPPPPIPHEPAQSDRIPMSAGLVRSISQAEVAPVAPITETAEQLEARQQPVVEAPPMPVPTPAPRPPAPKSRGWIWIVGGLLAAGVVGVVTWQLVDVFSVDDEPNKPRNGSGVASGNAPADAAVVAMAPDAAVVAMAPDAHLAEAKDAATVAPADAQVASAADAALAPADARVVAAADAGVPSLDAGAATPSDQLAITSTPKGARVFLDGADQGTTPVKLPGTPDRHTIALVLPNHELYVAQVDGHGSFTIPLPEITPPSGPAGIKVLKCKPDRYYVFVDGKPTGQTCPTERIGCEVGPHTVEVYDVVSGARNKWEIEVKDTRLSYRIRIEP
jgi:serine/threonine-protein kinase